MDPVEPNPTPASYNQGQTEQPFRFRVLLEPKGFIRIIEFVLAILTFSTTAGYSSVSKYMIICSQNTTYTYNLEYKFGYPFSFENYPPASNCAGANVTDLSAQAYPGGKSSFFVAIGVFAMLYCVVMLIWYVFFEVKFLNLDLVPLADLVLTAVFALFFFLASCAWASGVTTVKYWTSFDGIKDSVYEKICSNPANKCTDNGAASYSTLNASIIFGFLNLVVWLGNCWFVYKETTWFKSRQEQSQQQSKQEFPPNDM